jgi:selenocysteine lyase/cysteine desulfurase
MVKQEKPLPTRRDIMRAGVAVTAAGAIPAVAPATGRSFADRYDIDRSVINLDAAYYGPMTRSVAARYRANGAWVNRHNAVFLRSALPGPSRDARLQPAADAVAGLIGARPEEVALCAGGTEALYGLITNFAPLQAGDAAIMADIDYDEMQHAMRWLAKVRGAHLVMFDLPEPHSTANILAAYERVLRETPRARLLLLTHLSNRNGVVLPVREITAMARARGVDVILDAAQSVGQLPINVDDLGVDFMGFSLHKWIAAPLGTGGIFIRAERLSSVAPWLGNAIRDPDDIRARVPTGTIDYAARLTVPDAIAEHHALGEAKLSHVTALRNRWTDAARDVEGLTIVHPQEPERVAAIGAFRLPGQRDWAQAQAAQRRFTENHGVLIVAKRGLASGPVLRVTPALFNSEDDIDRLVTAIRLERNMFR